MNLCYSVVFCLLLGFSLTGYAQNQTEFPAKPATNKANIQLQYLGVGGYLIRYDDYQLLFAPSFSNPGYGELAQSVLSGELKANHTLIDKLYPDSGKDNPDQPQTNVSAILVGHAHYDHLLDVPYLMQKYTQTAKAYGSRTMQSILLTQGISSDRIVELNDKVTDSTNYSSDNWQYIADNRIRFMAIKANHAPHVGNVMFADGHYNGEPLKSGLDANEWRLGQTYAYVVDFLDSAKNIVFRLHYADAASSPPNGFLPEPMQKEKATDLAILCLAGFSKVEGYPQGIVKHLNPKYIIVGHWEDFFGNQDKPPEPVVGSDQEAFFKLLKQSLAKDTEWRMPKPMATLSY